MNDDEIVTDNSGVKIERVYPHSPERVWQALTDPSALSEWLLPTKFRPVLGHRFQFVDRTQAGRRHKVRCTVVELDPPRRPGLYVATRRGAVSNACDLDG